MVEKNKLLCTETAPHPSGIIFNIIYARDKQMKKYPFYDIILGGETNHYIEKPLYTKLL